MKNLSIHLIVAYSTPKEHFRIPNVSKKNFSNSLIFYIRNLQSFIGSKVELYPLIFFPSGIFSYQP
ncbi:hypothetical protein BpHYR1_007164 [Brachionus plicatilis]|uniref:Uncharacterized protein n=1 Tax=Brachionus plicatilis TaxID=10195 RepID=A0A3M7S717_BRAPC|nr:hypothetical protein BpHYR1_007164 [Brachionus plicatilis]